MGGTDYGKTLHGGFRNNRTINLLSAMTVTELEPRTT